MISAPLPRRSAFFEQLRNQRNVRVQPDEWECDGCERPLQLEPTDENSERIVLLHDQHVYGEDCIKEYLDTRNTCPMCNVILFQDEVSADDDINLKRIFNLRLQQDRCNESKNYETKAIFYEMWRGLADKRAERFFQGEVNVDLKEYTVFRGRADPQLTYLPPETRKVDAEDLVSRLDDFWDHLFEDAIQPIALDILPGTRRLTVLCHPISASHRVQMVQTLWRLNGVILTSKQLYHNLEQDFLATFWDKMNALERQKKAPQGFYIMNSLLCDAVLMWYVETKTWQDPARTSSCRILGRVGRRRDRVLTIQDGMERLGMAV